MSRMLLPMLLLLTASCHVVPPEPFAVLAGVEAASIAILGRDIGDLVISGVSGRDCSIVRLDRGQSYCRPVEPPPEPQPFCTRSLARIECWKNPEALVPPPRQVADGPTALTPAQEARRVRSWP